jgi:hypothetical protein
MNTSQIITLVVIIAALGGSMAYYNLKAPYDKPLIRGEVECTAAAASLPLVNVATGMGMAAAIAECE